MKKHPTIFVLIIGLFFASGLNACSSFGETFQKLSISEGEYIPVLSLPSGEIYDSTPVYRWTAVSGASEYKIQVYQGEVSIYNKSLAAGNACVDGVCSFSPSSALQNTEHRWRVQAYVNNKWQSFSEYLTFSFAADKYLLEQHSFNLEDCIYSWWTYPLAVRFNGLRDKTYLGYTDSQGYSGVASIDNSSGQIIKTRLRKNTTVDDHNAVAVEVLADGRIIAAYTGGHIKTSQIFVRISSRAESIEEFEDPVVIEAGKATTYTQLFMKNDKLWLFFRTGREKESSWSFSSSEDGLTWTEPLEIVSGGMQYYLKITDTTDKDLLRLVMYSNPDAGDTNIRLGFFDTATLELKRIDGTVLGFEKISKDLFPVIVPAEEGKHNRLLDVAYTDVDTTLVAYATFTDVSDAVYKLAYYNGGLKFISLVSTGDPFYTKSVYVGGLVFGYDPNTVYLSRESMGKWYIEEWQSVDEQSFEKKNVIHSTKPGIVAIRPIIEQNGNRLIWQEGYYNPASYSDFYTDLKYKTIEELN